MDALNATADAVGQAFGDVGIAGVKASIDRT
jgi:hypothetical protein